MVWNLSDAEKPIFGTNNIKFVDYRFFIDNRIKYSVI